MHLYHVVNMSRQDVNMSRCIYVTVTIISRCKYITGVANIPSDGNRVPPVGNQEPSDGNRIPSDGNQG